MKDHSLFREEKDSEKIKVLILLIIEWINGLDTKFKIEGNRLLKELWGNGVRFHRFGA